MGWVRSESDFRHSERFACYAILYLVLFKIDKKMENIGITTKIENKLGFLKMWVMFFFLNIGLQLFWLYDPFTYSHNYSVDILVIILLALLFSSVLSLSIFHTYRIIISGKFKIWRILLRSFISSLIYSFLFFIIMVFSLNSQPPSEGAGLFAILFLSVVSVPILFLILFVISLCFYKIYNKQFLTKLIQIIFIISIIFGLSASGLKIFDYYDCEFGKDADCVNSKALTSENADECRKNKYLNPYIRNKCYSEVGSRGKDLSVCDKINLTDSTADDMKIKCVANVARNTNKPSLCEKFKEDYSREDCYHYFNR